MDRAEREIETPAGAVWLRAERPTDEAFQFDLFRVRTLETLQPAGLPAAMIESLLTMQYRSRTQSYRTQFPDARWSIVEFEGAPIGELIEHDETDAVYVVDIAIRPERRGRGIGGALLRSVMRASAPRGMRAVVSVGNGRSLTMFRSLGFVETGDDGGANVELRWRSDGPGVNRAE